MTNLILKRQTRRARRFREPRIELPPDSRPLAMVFIPAGRFLMGAPATEEASRDSERPQHSVSVKAFFMGQYPVTQAQWRFVASLPKCDRDLKPDPSHFKGGDRPVERVNWFEAVEFCSRLSQHTGREYRLPSEAEWEYACRAGTETPFHFGETLSSEVANYNANDTYGAGQTGRYRRETTVVGGFPANEFGLHDMHGNVYEWCLDDWHQNYEGAPEDGSAWLNNKEIDVKYPKILRGGSWLDSPGNCRSASRYAHHAGDILNGYVGFRVVCVSARTLDSPLPS